MAVNLNLPKTNRSLVMWQLLCLVLAFGADHRETIVDGIDSIPVRGIPGTIAVWGEGAFPIVAGPDKSQPICAGAIFGKGRLVAIAHGAYVSGVHKGTPSSFMQNVIKWVGKKSQPRIGSVMIDSSSWGNFDILMFGHNDVLSSQKEELLLQWIENGGGSHCQCLSLGLGASHWRRLAKFFTESSDVQSRHSVQWKLFKWSK